MMKTSKWVPVARIAIVLFLIVLFFNAFSLFKEIRRDVIYNNRSYGLAVLNEYFDEGNFYEIYERTVENRYADDRLSVDVSQYEAFGQYYHNYMMARTHSDNQKYLRRMEEAKKQITWKKILNVIADLETELP